MKVHIRQMLKHYLALDEERKTVFRTIASMAFNAIFGIGKSVLGLLFSSPWFLVNGIFYLGLGGARGYMLQKYRLLCNIPDKTNRQKEEDTAYQHSGIFFLLLGLSYLLISLRMYFREETDNLPPYIVFAVVLMSFGKLIASSADMLFHRKQSGALVRTMRMLNLADAGVSIVVTRCALLLIVEAPDAISNSALFGIIVSITFIVAGGWVYVRPIYSQKYTR